jgi:hypothetical protein
MLSYSYVCIAKCMIQILMFIGPYIIVITEEPCIIVITEECTYSQTYDSDSDVYWTVHHCDN